MDNPVDAFDFRTEDLAAMETVLKTIIPLRLGLGNLSRLCIRITAPDAIRRIGEDDALRGGILLKEDNAIYTTRPCYNHYGIMVSIVHSVHANIKAAARSAFDISQEPGKPSPYRLVARLGVIPGDPEHKRDYSPVESVDDAVAHLCAMLSNSDKASFLTDHPHPYIGYWGVKTRVGYRAVDCDTPDHEIAVFLCHVFPKI